MPIGSLETEGDLEQFVKSLLDRLGIRSPSQLLAALLDTGGRRLKVRFGTEDVSVAADNAGSATVVHGLGSTPVIVLATTDDPDFFAYTTTYDATDFLLGIRQYQATSVTTTVRTYWLALG
jgi:hypothetical protein